MRPNARLALVLPLMAAVCVMEPAAASARTKSILKYGVISLGAAALYNVGQRSAYAQPRYHSGYAFPEPSPPTRHPAATRPPSQ